MIPNLVPQPVRLPAAWAEATLMVPDGPREGQRIILFEFQREILDAMGSDDVQEVDIMGSAQWGKTLCLLIFAMWTIAEDPCRVLWVLPNDLGAGGAKDFSRERLSPWIQKTPCVRDRVDGRRSAEGSNTANSKTFRGGSISLTGARSPSGIAARPIRRVLMDEIDRMPLAIGEKSAKYESGRSAGEGNPRAVAAKRTETFGRRRMVAQVSTPVNTGGASHAGFLGGDQRRFVVACPGCGRSGILGWQGMDFDAKTPIVAAVDWNAPDGSDAALVCRTPACRMWWTDTQRATAVAGGRWVAENPDSPTWRRSFHIWAAYSPLSRLHELADQYILAQRAAELGDVGDLTTFQQTCLGLPVGDEGIVLPSLAKLRASLLARRIRPGDWRVPEGCVVVAAADVHADRIEVLITAWDPKTDECWVEDLIVLKGKPTEPAIWEDLDVIRLQEYCGQPISWFAVDSGYLPNAVYEWVWSREREKVIAIKGYADRPFVTDPHKPPKRERRPWLWLVGTDEGKASVMTRLVKRRGTGAVHVPWKPWADQEFVSQLTSERTEEKWERGLKRIRWVPLRARNEALDLMVYSLYAYKLAKARIQTAV